MRTTVTLLIPFALFSSNTFAQDYTQWSLSEGAKARLGTRLAAIGFIGIWLYDAAGTYQEVALLTGYTNDVLSIAFSPDGRTLASGRGSTIRCGCGIL